jgi:hypothetical protein
MGSVYGDIDTNRINEWFTENGEEMKGIVMKLSTSLKEGKDTI